MSSDDLDPKLGTTTQISPERSMIGRGPARISLLIFHGDKTELATLADGQQLVVGRDPHADISVVDERLSRRHAFFQVSNGEVWVEDLKSTNGTKIDGRPLSREKLLPGQEVSMGSLRASIHVRAQAPSQRADNHEDFLQAASREVIRARAFGRGFAVLMVKLAEASDAPDPWCKLRRHLRPVDYLASYSALVCEILLAEADIGYARKIAEMMCGDDPAIRCGGALYPAAGGADEAIRSGLRALRQTNPGHPIHFAAGRDPSRPTSMEVGPHDGGIIISSPAMRDVYETVDRLAKSAISVLLVGETGSGKEVVARAIHERGPRASGPMASINCGAIPTTLVESVLFGHKKGAFTGASDDSPGLFEEAHGGTAFLDEIGELSASAQTALLRVLETKRVRRVGSHQERDVDVRVVAATHRDLEAMCATGEFRQDLLYRINTMVLRVPPLRERPEEIVPFCTLFLAEANEANGSSIVGIDREAMRALHRHAWPGNIRELRNVIERAVVITRGHKIKLVDLPECFQPEHAPSESPLVPLRPEQVQSLVTGSAEPAAEDAEHVAQHAPASSPASPPAMAVEEGPMDFKARMERVEVEILLEALRRAKGNRKKAAEALQMPVRTLSHKLNQYGIRKGYGLGD